MNKYCQTKLQQLNDQIDELDWEQDNFLCIAETAVGCILKFTSEIKDYIINRGFKTLEEEIHFFKHYKPQFLAKLIYYNAIYKLETKKPYGNKNIRKYFDNELSKLKRFFDNNIDFYKYYRTNCTYLDHKYFVRGKYDIKLSLDTFYFEADHSFSTSHDYKVAKILSNDLIQVYIEDQLSKKSQKIKLDNKGLKWSGSKTSLIELVYALHSKGVFNNGNTDIKLICKTFEHMFNIDLGDFYHTFMELKARKINRTKFLDNLRDALIIKMDEEDEK